jgi:hypothetical protein
VNVAWFIGWNFALWMTAFSSVRGGTIGRPGSGAKTGPQGNHNPRAGNPTQTSLRLFGRLNFLRSFFPVKCRAPIHAPALLGREVLRLHHRFNVGFQARSGDLLGV